MPSKKCCSLYDENLVKAKSKKSNKNKHESESEYETESLHITKLNCCISNDCNPDCCTPGFQRLDKLRNQWALINTGLPVTSINYSGLFNRSGVLILPPNTTIGNITTTPVTPIQYNNPLASSQTTPNTNIINTNNEVQAYYFVNVMRYLSFEECGKRDQVLGWSVNVQTGELVLYQNLPELNLTVSTSRANLLSYSQTNLTNFMAEQLHNLEAFWKLSLKAIDSVKGNPKEEGNICEIKDKCGNRFLVAINRVNGVNSVVNYNSQYSIVAVRLN